jgi:pimeloyl-ACP methyl ester carboxylesterase
MELSIFVPDLLGYGGTSKPLDPIQYNSKGMANDLVECFRHNVISQIVIIGHDFGSFMAQRVWLWHPALVAGVVLLNAAYSPPGKFDLDRANAKMEQVYGLPLMEYWNFFTAPDAAKLMGQNIESTFAALHGKPDDWYGTLLCRKDALREFVANDRRIAIKPYAEDQQLRENWIRRFGGDGFVAPVRWYSSHILGHQWTVEKELPRERWIVSVPLLFIGATNDAICPPSMMEQVRKAGLSPKLTTRTIPCGHWMPLEAPKQSAEYIGEWLRKNFSEEPQSRI